MSTFPGSVIELHEIERDAHSYAEPEKFRVRHLDLELEALFDKRILRGTAILSVEALGPPGASLILDTRDLTIARVETAGELYSWKPARYELRRSDAILGTPLAIDFPRGASKVRISYSTSPNASGLQWLNPVQTTAKRSPFLFTQSQEIHARSWVPLQDTPAVRFTFTARIKAPAPLVALMAAVNEPPSIGNGVFGFRMEYPIPSYLLALAVGELAFAPTGPRTGVYAEPGVLEAAVREFSDAEQMLQAAETLYGRYRWGRYDLLVLPPSFPFGGMENPTLTFISPTLITGDKGLVILVAHELAHSWAGNLVTNATWSDFWLNEGFTTYIERRVQEAVYGAPAARMEDVLGRQELDAELKKLPPQDQILHIDLKGRDPDDGATSVPYEKGALLLKSLEQEFGRAAFDDYLRKYFDFFAFQSITTRQAIDFLQANLLMSHQPRSADGVNLQEWIYQPGIPASAPRVVSERLAGAEEQAARWSQGKITAGQVDAAGWTTHEWRRFLGVIPLDLGKDKMRELDEAFHLTASRNAEIMERWLQMAARNQYEPAYPRIEDFLLTVGRKKYLKPLYKELMNTPDGSRWAARIYAKARPAYHPITRTTLDKILRAEADAGERDPDHHL